MLGPSRGLLASGDQHISGWLLTLKRIAKYALVSGKRNTETIPD